MSTSAIGGTTVAFDWNPEAPDNGQKLYPRTLRLIRDFIPDIEQEKRAGRTGFAGTRSRRYRYETASPSSAGAATPIAVATPARAHVQPWTARTPIKSSASAHARNSSAGIGRAK